MADTIDKRIDIKKFDKKAIDNISSEIVRSLTTVAEQAPDAEGAFHAKIGHIEGSFSLGPSHIQVVIGGPAPNK